MISIVQIIAGVIIGNMFTAAIALICRAIMDDEGDE